ncbi:MAG TPA: Sir2 silent information regulator family NAD-dependent deacetylase [Candidatus Gallacutalibacter stercoravium]|nr:Sir2 silent information regulator family NAD-dependent deacetylase [Candidatus Gallacutalibacter stercoravium]
MFLKRPTIPSTESCSEQIYKLKRALNEAQAVIIGAGAGLSTSAGFIYDGDRFAQYFSDFEKKYGFHDMYSGGFYPYPTPEEHWAYWSRYIYCNRYIDPPFSTYRDLLGLVKEKDYFVITTNVDHCFQKAGFDKKRLFYTQGDYGLFQCSEPCCNETFDNKDIVYQMIAQQKDMRVPSALLPICPHCGKPLTMNLRSDNKFVEDEGWHLAAERYASFLRTRKNLRILFLEIGVGYNTPGIIKYPFWQMTYQNQKAVYACVNNGEAWAPKEIAERSICINKDNREVLRQVANEK